MTNHDEKASTENTAFSVTLKHILLVKVAAERKPSPAETLEVRPSASVKTDIRYKGEQVEAFFTVGIVFPNPDKPFCTLEYTMRSAFAIAPAPAVDTEHQRIVSSLVTSAAWPYLRKYAESLFRDMEILGALPLPYTVSVQEVLEKLEMTSR